MCVWGGTLETAFSVLFRNTRPCPAAQWLDASPSTAGFPVLHFKCRFSLIRSPLLSGGENIKACLVWPSPTRSTSGRHSQVSYPTFPGSMVTSLKQSRQGSREESGTPFPSPSWLFSGGQDALTLLLRLWGPSAWWGAGVYLPLSWLLGLWGGGITAYFSLASFLQTLCCCSYLHSLILLRVPSLLELDFNHFSPCKFCIWAYWYLVAVMSEHQSKSKWKNAQFSVWLLPRLFVGLLFPHCRSSPWEARLQRSLHAWRSVFCVWPLYSRATPTATWNRRGAMEEPSQALLLLLGRKHRPARGCPLLPVPIRDTLSVCSLPKSKERFLLSQWFNQ